MVEREMCYLYSHWKWRRSIELNSLLFSCVRHITLYLFVISNALHATKSARDDGFKSTLSSLPGTVHEPYVKWILKRTKQLAYRTVISKLKLVYDLCVYSVYKGNVIANSLWDYHSNFRKWGGKCESARRDEEERMCMLWADNKRRGRKRWYNKCCWMMKIVNWKIAQNFQIVCTCRWIFRWGKWLGADGREFGRMVVKDVEWEHRVHMWQHLFTILALRPTSPS